MKPFSILLIKILALYLLLTTLYSFAPVIFSGNINNLIDSELIIVLITSILLPAIGGIILWIKAELIASKIHSVEPVITTANIQGNEIVRAGLFLIGIVLLIKHINILINHYFIMQQIDYGSIFVTVISVLLVFRNSSLMNIYCKNSNK